MENYEKEAQRTKDRALIQTLVNALADPHKMSNGSAALDEAKENGFTPTEE